jgi:acetyl esterase/lipase
VRFTDFIINTNMAVGGLTEKHDHNRIDHVKGVWIDPCPSFLLVDEVAQYANANGVKPVQIPGYWQCKPGHDIPNAARAESGERVILFLHGGGFFVASAHPDDPLWDGPREVLQQLEGVHRAFAVEYRLSSRSSDGSSLESFPAALIDSISGYIHLLNLGFIAENIIVYGDSAGGNLAHALTRYLVENRSFLENAVNGIRISPPSSLIMLSPWVDLGSSHDEPIPPYFSRADFFWTFGPVRVPEKWAQHTFTGHLGIDSANTNRFISPASKFINNISFTGFPRTFLSWGGVETLKPSILTLKARMSACMKDGEGEGQLKCLEAPEACHDFTATQWAEPERTNTLKAIAKWIDFIP